SPPNFQFTGAALRLERDAEFEYFIDRAGTASKDSFRAAIPPGNDTGPGWARDDLPPTIFDFDAPGVAKEVRPSGTIIRNRFNAKAFASVRTQGKNVRCSEMTRYFVVLSMKQTVAPSGSTWVQVNDVAGDNKADSGSTKITWNLQ